MQEEKTTYSKTNITIGIVLAVVVIGIIVLSVLSYVNTTSDKNDIYALQVQLANLQSKITAANNELTSLSGQVADADSRISTLSSQESSDVASLQDELSTANNQISSLTDQINSALLQISSLQSDVSSDTVIISSIQTQLSSINSQLSSLGDTTVSLQNTLTLLENTVDSLVNQVNTLTAAATNPVTLFPSQTISQAYSTQTLLHTFTPIYNGYIYISGISSSATAYIRVTNNTTSTFTDYAFGTGSTVSAAVNGGYSYSIRFGNSDASGTITTTLSAIYYPTSSSTTNSITLFSSMTISQAFGAQTLLYTFTPTYNGYIYISGTSSSATGYIRVINNTTSTFTDYAFGTGTTVTTVVYAGYSYSIRFGNSDASGTITATLSAVYYY